MKAEAICMIVCMLCSYTWVVIGHRAIHYGLNLSFGHSAVSIQARCNVLAGSESEGVDPMGQLPY
eukprot:7123577-Prymnesium_polylepis.1